MENKMINGARILLESLYRLGVRDMFGYPGGTVIPIYDEIYNFEGINHYFSRHEQGAAHEADGYARASGKVGVCLATSGPGATNLVTGIMTAHMDSTPMIAITGQVASSLLGKDAFQESDIVGITVPITKMNYLIQDIRELPRVIKEAYFIASTGRQGPVLIDIPKDIQTHEIPVDEFEEIFGQAIDLEGYDPTYHGHPIQIKKAKALIAEAKKPVILAGAGILKSKASQELLELAEKTQIPVASTLLGLGGFPSSHELSLGMIGMHGTVTANYATDEADLIIAAGMRFDDRITGDTSKFCRDAKVIHIDIDPAEIGKNKCIDVPIVGDLKNVLRDLNFKVEVKDHSEWIEKIDKWKEEYPKVYVRTSEDKLMPQEVLMKINSILKGDCIVTTDVGQHQMWAAQFMDFENPDSMLTSGGSGTMGFGLPSSIGAQIAKRDKKVIAVVGDGGFQMTYQELMLLKQYDLPIKIILLNNSYLGMVRQWQEIFNEKRYSFVDLDFNPDFNKIAEAYGIKNALIKTKEELETGVEELLMNDEAVLINFIVEKEANVYPMIPAGADVSKIMGTKGVL